MKTYITKAGDMWDSIAYTIWGNEMLMSDLIAANLAYSNVVVFGTGLVLAVPEIAQPTFAGLPPWQT